jgi:hypothetical protein
VTEEEVNELVNTGFAGVEEADEYELVETGSTEVRDETVVDGSFALEEFEYEVIDEAGLVVGALTIGEMELKLADELVGILVVELTDEDEGVEEAWVVLDTAAGEPKISVCAPDCHPQAALYPGETPFGGNTLLPSAWFHAIICLAPFTHLELSSLQ